MSFGVTAAALVIAWVAFLGTFALIARRSNKTEQRRDSSSLVGVLVQGTGFSVIVVFPRALGAPLFSLPEAQTEVLQWIVRISALSLAYGSVWLTAAALRALGKQWAYAARIIEGHPLVRTGPYQLVRHPIYTSMISMNVATALVFARWEAVLASLFFSALGTWIRVRREERLMRETFGSVFDAYKHSVPAIVPGLRFPGARPTSA